MCLFKNRHIDESHHFYSCDVIMKQNGQPREISHCYISLTMEMLKHGIHLWKWYYDNGQQW